MNDLRVFVVVALLKSIRNAATLLHMSDDAVSRTLHRLERECHWLLFTRHNRGGVQLTRRGEDMLRLALPLVTAFTTLPI